MITLNTVLILGAGASSDYGYPLGDELKLKVIRTLSHSDFQEALKDGYGIRPGIKYMIPEFIEDLENDRALTLDRFLAKSTDDYKKLGKVAIAKTIMDCENEIKIFQNTTSWYKTLYTIISGYPDLDSFAENKISILTFNYDRSLEHFLFTQLTGDHGDHHDKICPLIKRIPIIHLHGRVNVLPWEDSHEGCPYARKGFVPDIFKIAEKMFLPSDDANFEDARSILEKADIIYFLGFGYDQINLHKLGLNLISKCKRVFGTAFGLPIARQHMINKLLGGGIIKFSDLRVYDFLMKEFSPYS